VSEGSLGAVPQQPPSENLVERYFRFRENGTDLRTETIAGVTTFVVMSYIIAVNPAILNRDGDGLPVREVATVTCLASAIITLAMGLYANRAIALAPGLGLNAIVAFSLAGSMGLTFPEAMGVVVTEGLISVALVLLGVRRLVMDTVPLALKQGIAVGIGFFILVIGLTNAGLITFIPGPAGTTGSVLELSPLDTWPIFVAVTGLAITLVLYARGVYGALIIGIITATAIAFVVPGDVAVWPDDAFEGPDFSLVGDFSFGYWAELGVLTALLAILSLMLADFFDTMGSLVGVGRPAGYLDNNGDFIDVNKPLLVDSLGAVTGGVTSASTVTTYIESAAGIETGGRTGFVAVVTGLLFLLTLPFVALVQAIPLAATSPALILVGFLLVGALSEGQQGEEGTPARRGIDFTDLEQGLPVVLTMLVMPLTFSITNGIGAGFTSYVAVKLARGKWRDVHPAVYVVAAAFTLYFARWALFGAKF
jgi:AGZA family xanthine/uracil permease-like MFS transporter